MLRSDISVSKERQKSVSSNIVKYESEIIELNNRIESTKKIIAQALLTTSNLTNEIDKNRELKDRALRDKLAKIYRFKVAEFTYSKYSKKVKTEIETRILTDLAELRQQE